MKRIGPFFFGMIVGGGLVFGALRYHVVRTNEGFELIPKATATLGETFVDVRRFGASEWAEHKDLAMALMRADKSHVVQDSTVDQFQQGVNQFMGELTGDRGTIER